MLFAVERETPGYYELIETPMDLSTIERRLNDGTYSGLLAVEADFRLMYRNCIQYNQQPHGRVYIVRAHIPRWFAAVDTAARAGSCPDSAG